MTAKEYLSQLETMNIKIKHLLDEKQDLYSSLMSISSIDYSKDRVSGGNVSSDAVFVNKIIHMITLEEKINKNIDEYADLKHTIIGQIHNLQSLNHIKLLYKLYVENKSLKHIAKEMNYTYQYVRELHQKALAEFERTYTNLH